MNAEKIQTAHHEAGHAVIGRVLGLRCGYVTIIADDESAGHSIINDPWDTITDWEKRQRFRDPRQAYRGTIIARMAGAEAECLFFGRCNGGDGDDRRWIGFLMDSSDADIPADNWERCEARLRAQTRRLVRRHKGQIERVAAALLDRDMLQPEEVDALL